ncbi:MAG: hypothetical protein HN348_17890 [Proteobacteria bacterium]|nr:hypothetical protein [Pseudomonadota bacterium]
MVCDHVVMMDRGQCTKEGPIVEMTGRSMVMEWTLGPGEPDLVALQERLPGHEIVLESHVLIVCCPIDADLDATSILVGAHLVGAEIAVRELRRGRTLEKSYLDNFEEGKLRGR